MQDAPLWVEGSEVVCGGYSVSVNSAAGIASNCDVSLLVDLRVGRVEGLREAVVEDAWGAIVLSSDHDHGLDVAVLHVAHLLVLSVVHAHTRNVSDPFFSRLLGLLLSLD